MSGIPKKSISELCQVIDCEHKTTPYIEKSIFHVVRTSNIRNGNIDLNDIRFTTEKAFHEWTNRAVPRYGDVLFTREAPAGESCLVPKDLKVCMGQRMVLLRPKKDLVESIYLSNFLLSQNSKRQIHKYTIGTTVTRINIEDILKISLPSFSLLYQKKLSNLFFAVDKKIQLLQQKSQRLQEYKRGMMQKLFSQEIRFRQDDGSEFPEWEMCYLKDLTKIYDGTHQTPKYVDDGIPFYSVEHLTSDNFANTKYISEDIYQKEIKRVVIEKGDILMTRIGNIGTPKLVDWDVKASFYVSLALIKKSDQFFSAFLSQFICSNFFQRELYKKTIHVAFPKKINLGEIGNCTVLLPSFKEQQKIADFLSTIDKKIQLVQQQVLQMQSFKQGLLQKMFV